MEKYNYIEVSKGWYRVHILSNKRTRTERCYWNDDNNESERKH